MPWWEPWPKLPPLLTLLDQSSNPNTLGNQWAIWIFSQIHQIFSSGITLKLSEVKLKEISEKQSAIQSGEWALEMALGHPSFFQFFQQFSQSNSLDTILYYDIYDHCPMAVPISQAWAMGMWASPGPCPAIFKNLSVWDSQWQGSGRKKVIECSNTKAHVSVH